jgi:competence protein ComEC
MGMGLWLSAGAVFALIWLRTNNWQVHWKLAVILLPMTALWLKASLISPIANALAIPYVSLLVVPGALIGVMMDLIHIPGAEFLLKVVGWLIDYLWLGLVWISQYAYLLSWSLLSWIDWIVLIGLIICLLLPWRLVGAIPIVILIASLTWAKPVLPDPGIVLLHVIDAAQGTALLVQVGEKNLLFDAGNGVVTDYLLHHRVRKLDRVIISHHDKDHRAGLADLLEHVVVEQMYVGEKLSESPTAKPCLAGETWRWGEVKFEFLSPLHQGYRGNNASCVLKISVGEHSLLFTGDIEQKIEAELLSRLDSSLLKSTILIAPHHGSKTSSSPAFIRRVSPQIVIYPTGFLNSYHHPHPTIVERYAELGVKQYNTAQDGALSVKLSKHGIEAIRCYKKDHAYWWNRDEEATCSGYLAQVGY